MLFERADKVSKKEVRDSASEYLRNLEIGKSVSEWPIQYANLFDAVFGERHFRWKCFWRSSVASLILVTLLILLWLALDEDYNYYWSQAEGFFSGDEAYSAAVILVTMLLCGAILNIVPDYFSLLETRWILRRFGKDPDLIRILFLVIIDLVATSVIFLSFYYLIILIVGDPHEALLGVAAYYCDAFYFVGHVPIEVFFYSTFFTSVWLWLYMLTSIVVICISKLGKIWLWLRDSFLDIEKQPILAMGWIASMIITIFFLAAFPFAMK